MPRSAVKIRGLMGCRMMLNRLLSTPIPRLRLEAPGKAGGIKSSLPLKKSRDRFLVPSNFNVFGSTSNHHPTTIRRGFLLLLSRDGALNDLRGHPLRIIEVGLGIAMDVYRKGFLSFHLLKIFSRYSCISAEDC